MNFNIFNALQLKINDSIIKFLQSHENPYWAKILFYGLENHSFVLI